MPSSIVPLNQEMRPPCSLPMRDADLSLGNANWTKGLQSMSDWIWSGNLNPVAFPNNLGRYFLQIPAIFEQQLNFSTTLIFDEPSFRNGIQVSGFVDRVSRELVISLIGQRRHSWYTMTHHAVLGYFTAKKHGLSDTEYADKWSKVTEHSLNPDVYSKVEQQVLEFADAFATNPKRYSDQQYQRLRAVLKADNRQRYVTEGRWMDQLNAARATRALALTQGLAADAVDQVTAKAASSVPLDMPDELNDRKVNAQIVEIAFLALQFVALTDVFSGLNVPDEAFLPEVMQSLLPDAVILRLNELNQLGHQDLPDLVPPPVDLLPLSEILSGNVTVEPGPSKGTRIPLVPYETNMTNDLDKGLTVGGAQVGVYGWSFGYHFPGSLVYALLLHPELGRFEAPYSLPLLFNEDEWRNGTHTGGYVSRILRELVYQKIYKTLRSRYGLEHHTMFLYNACLDLYGVGRPPHPILTEPQREQARKLALQKANSAVIYILDHEHAPAGIFSGAENAVLSWAHRMITQPHLAYELEPSVRAELELENRREVGCGLRQLDTTPGIGEDAAYRRLVDHQIAELAMLIGHMDGLGRLLTILRLESEEPVQIVQGAFDPVSGGITPDLNDKGQIVATGYFNNRAGLVQILMGGIGASQAALTVNELVLNPELNQAIKEQLASSAQSIHVNAAKAAQTGEF
jgi:hypothetical protein